MKWPNPDQSKTAQLLPKTTILSPARIHTMPTPSITNKQKQIIDYLYKFRFLTVYQLQQLLHHKDPHRIKAWLKDLKDKQYIAAIVDHCNVTKPYIYCLDSKSRKIFKDKQGVDKAYLGRIYKEKQLSAVFRSHLLFIADIYLYFLKNQEKDTTLFFLTRQDLVGYDYFPQDLPDAYIAVSGKKGTSRYFLDLFDEYRKAIGIARFCVRKYIEYSESGSWAANTNNAIFPVLLFVLPNEKRKKHIFYYGRAKLEKTFDEVRLFLTTQDKIKFSKDGNNIWDIVG